MVLEIAEFAVTPGEQDRFAAAYRVAEPSRFVLLVEWDTLGHIW